MEPINLPRNFKFTATDKFQNNIRVAEFRTDGRQGSAYLLSRIIMAVLHIQLRLMESGAVLLIQCFPVGQIQAARVGTWHHYDNGVTLAGVR